MSATHSKHPRATLVAMLTVGVAASLSLAGAAQANRPAAEKERVDSEIAAAVEGLAGTNAELQSAYNDLVAAQSKLPAAREAAQQAQQEADDARALDRKLDGELSATAAALQSAEQAVVHTGAAIAESTQTLGAMASHIYRTGAVDNTLLMALTSDDLSELATKYELAQTAMQSQGAAKALLDAQRDEQQVQRDHLAAVQADLDALKTESERAVAAAAAAEQVAAAKEAEVQTLVAAAQAATDLITARKAEEEAELAELRQQAAELEAEMARLAEAERARAAAQAAAAEQAARDAAAGASGGEPASPAPKGEPAPAAGSGGTKLAQPGSGRVTSPYGMRVHPIYKTKRMHTGMDFGGGCGAPIRAAEAGSVHRRGRAGGYGNQIVINHGVVGGEVLATSYSHLKSFKVAKGDTVSRGQIIGFEGTTGASTGCHLHFEVFADGKRTNPAPYLGK